MQVKEIKLEEGLSTCDEALSLLKSAVQSAKQSKYKCLIIIHGYGSSGKGGKIREKARQLLNAQVRNGKLKSVINGKDFNIFTPKALELKNKYKELESLMRVTNHGVTVVEL